MGITFASPKIETSFGKTVRATRVSADIPGVIDNGFHLAIHDEKTGFNIPCSTSSWMVFDPDDQLVAVLTAREFAINYGEPLEFHRFKLLFSPAGSYRTTAFLRGGVGEVSSQLGNRTKVSFTVAAAGSEELEILTGKPCTYRSFVTEVISIISAVIEHRNLVNHITNLLDRRDQPDNGENIDVQERSISIDDAVITMVYTRI